MQREAMFRGRRRLPRGQAEYGTRLAAALASVDDHHMPGATHAKHDVQAAGAGVDQLDPRAAAAPPQFVDNFDADTIVLAYRIAAADHRQPKATIG
jgi:transposase